MSSDKADGDTEANIKEEIDILSNSYFETDYSSKSINTSTLRTIYSPKSVLTEDFQDSSSPILTKINFNDAEKPSIVREYSREFPISKHELIDIKKSSDLIFKQVELSDLSLLIRKKLKAIHLANKIQLIKDQKNLLLKNVIELENFSTIFDIPVTTRYCNKICFNENLIISFDPGCEIPVNFYASDLQLNQIDKQLISDFSEKVGVFSIKIENIRHKFIISCNSELSINDSIAGTKITSMILENFNHVEEKKTEWYFENEKKIEKCLHVVMENENYVAFLDHKDINKVTNRRGEINLKDSGNFVQDGGVYVLMRYLIVKEFVGNFDFWSMDINGKIGLCKMDVGVHRNIIINNLTYNTIRIKKELYRSNMKKEVSKTYFLSTGHIILHKWKGCSYYIHVNNTLPIPAKYEWNFTNNWMNDVILLSQFEDQKNHIKTIIQTYINEHPRIKNLLHDYLLSLLLLKPENVLEYTINFFLNMFRE